MLASPSAYSLIKKKIILVSLNRPSPIVLSIMYYKIFFSSELGGGA